MRGRPIGVLVVAVLLTTACGSAIGSGATRDGPAPVSAPGSARCPIDGLREGTVPAGFATAWVLRCSQVERPVAGAGRWLFRVEERADSGLDPLLTALSAPDEKLQLGSACSGMAFGASPVALVDSAGRVVHPRLPQDGCGEPQQSVRDALAALRFREVRASRLHQEQSQQSIDTGCDQMWIDLNDEMLAGKPAGPRPAWPKAPKALLICLWQTQGPGQPRLLASRTVTGSELTSLLDRLDRVPAPGAACTVPHHRFTVIEYLRHGQFDSAAYAELDGCRRIMRPDRTHGQLDQATADLISRLA